MVACRLIRLVIVTDLLALIFLPFCALVLHPAFRRGLSMPRICVLSPREAEELQRGVFPCCRRRRHSHDKLSDVVAEVAAGRARWIHENKLAVRVDLESANLYVSHLSILANVGLQGSQVPDRRGRRRGWHPAPRVPMIHATAPKPLPVVHVSTG